MQFDVAHATALVGGAGGGESGPRADPGRCQTDSQQTAVAAAAAAQAQPASATGQRQQVTWAGSTLLPRAWSPGASRAPRALRAPRASRASRAPRTSGALRRGRKRRRRSDSPHIPSTHNFDDPPDFYDEHRVQLHRRVQEGVARVINAISTFAKYKQGIQSRLQRARENQGALGKLQRLIALYKAVPEEIKTNEFQAAIGEFESELEATKSSLKSFRRTESRLPTHLEQVTAINEELRAILTNVCTLQGLLLDSQPR